MSVDLSGRRLGHYLLREVIGRGGMSVVYRATDERLERSVALKVMSENLSTDPEFRTRFAEEARAASAIDHVNVVPLYDFGEAEGWLYIAMRLVDGTDLARELAAGPIPVRRVLNLLGQVGAALDMLHERGLVHLDVKPANVLITRNESVGTEHVYLADFGLTRRDATGHATASGDFLGSPTFASPEHLQGQEVLPSADEYSLTCMLFTALAGRAPFVGDVRTVITGHLSGQVPSLSALTGLPTAIDRVIARGLAHDPRARYPTSVDLLAATRRALSGFGESSTPRMALTQVESGPTTWGSGGRSPDGSDDPTGPNESWLTPDQLPGGPAPGGPGDPSDRPDGAYRQTSHRIQPKRVGWPWLVGIGLVVVAGATTILLLTQGSGAPHPTSIEPSTATTVLTSANSAPPLGNLTSSAVSGSAGPTRTPPPTTAPSLILPSQIVPSGLSSVSGLPDPFSSTG